MNSPSQKKIWIGTIAVIGAAIAFGVALPLARLAYEAGSNPATLVEIRFLIAIILLSFLIHRRRTRLPALTSHAPLITLLIVGLASALASGGYMASVELIPAGMASLLFYTFPIQVTLLAWALRQEPLTAARLIAGSFCLVGVGLAIGVAPVLPNLLGVALALIAAAGVATLIVLSARIMRVMDQLVVQASSTLIATFCFTIWMVSTGGPAWPTGTIGWVALLGSAGISAIANICFLTALGWIGPGRAALLTNLEPVTVLALAPLLLNEHLSALQLAGAALVLATITILPAWESRTRFRQHSI